MGERRDVTRSKSTIKQAYFALLFRKEQPKITVNDILEEANISRGTFYSHFNDIPDLGEQLENDIITACRKIIKQRSLTEIIRDPYPQVEMCVNMLEGHSKEIRALANHHQGTDIAAKFKHLIKQGLIDTGYVLPDPEASLLLYSCITGALVDTSIDWIINDYSMDKKVLIQTICDFLSGGMLKVTSP